MKGELLILTGAAVGYVLGTRAGRQRYEEIKGRANAWWQDPKVQQRVSDAEQAVRAKAPHVQERLTEAAERASEKAKPTVQRHDADAAPEARATGAPAQYSCRQDRRL